MTMCAFLDLDGVLAEFMSSCLKLAGMTQADVDANLPLGSSRWNFWRLKLTDDEMWRRVAAAGTFWDDLPKMPDADDIVALCERYFGHNVYLLTSPIDDPDCAAGKRRWVRRHYPQYYKRAFIGSEKHAIAGPDKVLVDDSDGNCQLFHHEGGKVVLVPRPWNELHAYETLPAISEQLEMIFKG